MLRTTRLLNTRLLAALSQLGHGEVIVIVDAGMPVGAARDVLDLAVEPGLPSFADVVSVVLESGQFESCVVAAESAGREPFERLAPALASLRVQTVSHSQLKSLLPDARLVVRTGECTPYANVALLGGVTF